MDSKQTAKRQFIEHLNVLRREAGSPSLAWLERLSDRKLVKTTLDDHLSDRRVGLPSWPLVSAYVAACHRAAEATGLEVRKLGSLQDWHSCYRAALEGDSEASCPVQTLSASGRESATPPEVDDGPTTKIDDRSTTSVIEAQSCTSCGRASPYLTRYCANCGMPMKADHGDFHSVEGTDDLFAGSMINFFDVRERARTMPRESAILLVSRGSESQRFYVIEKSMTTIGRDASNDIWLDEPSVSRRHSTIVRTGYIFTIRDIGSLNRTFVNQKPIDRHHLQTGDVIHIGIVRFVFLQGGSGAVGEWADDLFLRSASSVTVTQRSNA